MEVLNVGLESHSAAAVQRIGRRDRAATRRATTPREGSLISECPEHVAFSLQNASSQSPTPARIVDGPIRIVF